MEEIQKTYHQDGKLKKSKSTHIGSILLIISALLPCLDVILKLIFPSLATLRDSTGVLVTVNIWLGNLYFAPTLILIAVSFKPNKNLYILPIIINFYSGMIYFAPTWGYKVDFFRANSIITGLYSILAAIAIMFLTRYIRRLVLQENKNEEFYDDAREEFRRLQNENNELRSKLKQRDNDNHEGSGI